MAWPYTPLLTFVDNSTPFVTASFLNSLQSATNDLYTGAVADGSARLRYEDWDYDPAAGPWQNATLPDGRWKGFVNATFANNVGITDPGADVPWSHLYLHTDGANGGWSGIQSANQLVRAHTVHNLIMDGWYGINVTGTGYKFYWGWTDTLTSSPSGTSHRYALFKIDSTGTYWQCISADATAEQATTTTVAFPTATTAKARLRIRVNGTTSVGFYIDGTLVATHSTRVPAGAALYAYAVNAPTGVSTYETALGPLLVGYALA
jgi:hypothetical protein